MCAILGIIPKKNQFLTKRQIRIFKSLYVNSISRGQDASGLAIISDKEISVLKLAQNCKKLIKSDIFGNLINENLYAAVGHSRMETNGNFANYNNNQPVVSKNTITLHNGIIVNDKTLFSANHTKPKYEVDTEIINFLFEKYNKLFQNECKAISKIYNKIEGAASIAIINKNSNLLHLATNTGSLYYLITPDEVLFASESRFLEKTITTNVRVKNIKAGEALTINIVSKKIYKWKIDKPLFLVSPQQRIIVQHGNKTGKKSKELNDIYRKVRDLCQKEYQLNQKRINSIQRCTKCILPTTMPFISFDKDGVCNFCQDYKKKKVLGKDNLLKLIQQSKSKKCIVAFSGGRDSSYVLHYIKKTLKLNPIAFSYDWGMLTALGRRNQSRMTSKLGVEHILVSANITQKRENIKLNVDAWLARPSLGTIPLFMAGDKQYFYHANKLKKEYRTNILIMGENHYERTSFKNGFANTRQDRKGSMAYNVSFYNKLSMLMYYAKEFIFNPKYINKSIFDTFTSYLSYFVLPHKYINFFDYVDWDEKTIDKTLKKYNWEKSPETSSTWRIGDGTVAFYNYIYYTVAGFTEADTFLSNLLRAGKISRVNALRRAVELNSPQPRSIAWYLKTINIDPEYALKKINDLPKKY